MKEKINRIRKNHEFVRVYREGRRIPGRYSVLVFKKNGLEINRFGFSISRKVGISVRRHHIKRLYVESLRRMEGNLKKGYDFVVIARRQAATMNYHDCYKELENMLHRIRLWNEGGSVG